MRRGAILLGLLLLLPACGPAGHPDLGATAPPRAADASQASTPGVRRLVRRPAAPAASEPSARAPGAEATVSVAADAQTPWPRVRDRLVGAVAGGASQLVLEERAGGGGRRVVWHPPGTDRDAVRPDVHLLVVFVMQDGEEALDVMVEGNAWTAWAGCDGPARWCLPGWGDEARSAFGRRLDEVARAAASDPRRVAVRLEVSTTVQTAVEWCDVYPLVEEAILCGVGEVAPVPTRRGRRALPCTEASLTWLAAHQAPDGRWRAAEFGAVCGGSVMRHPATDGAGDPAYDVGATGLALLAFLGAGYTNRGRHEFARTVSVGMRFLRASQAADGSFVPAGTPWAAEQHAIATLALVEIHGLTGSPLWRGAAQRGLDALPVDPATDDLDAFAWSVAAYASVHLLHRDAVQRGREPALVSDPVTAERLRDACEAWSGSERPEGVAVGLFGRILLGGEDPRGAGLREVACRILERPPAAGAGADAVHELFGTLVLHQVGGAPWKAWNHRIKDLVIDSQRRDGAACCYRGSWDAVGVGAGRFGRVGATALRALSQEVYYRYDKVFGNSN